MEEICYSQESNECKKTRKEEDKNFAVKLNLSGYKPDEIKVQLRGKS